MLVCVGTYMLANGRGVDVEIDDCCVAFAYGSAAPDWHGEIHATCWALDACIRERCHVTTTDVLDRASGSAMWATDL